MPPTMEIPSLESRRELTCDVLVVGGGTAGTMAAITAGEAGADVLLMEKAHVRHSGALAMGMDGVNNAVIPGKATPEDYVAEITRANDGVINQRTVMQTATRGFAMVQRLEGYGVKFEKDEYGDYAVRRVHRSGSYVLPMPEGKDVKKVLYRVLRQRHLRDKVRIENRVMPVRVLTHEGRAVGIAGFDTRSGEFVTVRAGAVILATGAAGRLGLPASGYLYGTYENPTNAGDGHAMAFHAGAELSGLECFQVNPLIKDYNGPACAYVANPFGGYQVNADGDRFVDCDYWSGQMMSEVKREIDSARGPIYLKLSHLPDETLTTLEGILHHTERPTRGTFHAGRAHDYRTHDVEMHISEIGLCGGHSSSGVWVDENARTTVAGLYAAGDLACVPHNYMVGAFVYGDLAGAHAAGNLPGERPELPEDQVAAAHELVYRPLRYPHGPPQTQVEYKLRRFVNEYVAPPKTARKLELALETFARMEREVETMGARTPHELMRCVEVSFIRDCAELATQSSLVREESRWGLYHERADVPESSEDWFCHLNIRRRPDGRLELVKRPVAPYLVEVDGYASPETVNLDPELYAVVDPAVRRIPFEQGESTRKAPGVGRSPRLLELLELAEREDLTLAELEPFLTDRNAQVRRTAVQTLTETTPAGSAEALVARLSDKHESVVSAAAAALRELVEVIEPDEALGAALRDSARVEEPVARAAVLDLLRATHLGDPATFRAALEDDDHLVRQEAVRGLVSLDDVAGVAAAADDARREVRVTVAHALATIGNPAGGPALERLAGDPEPLVRAAALEATAGVGSPPELIALATRGLEDPAWQIRVGAVRGLAAADLDSVRALLVPALDDPNLDVRKAAVIALGPWAGDDVVAEALEASTKDSDADVRGYARRALRPAAQAS